MTQDGVILQVLISPSSPPSVHLEHFKDCLLNDFQCYLLAVRGKEQGKLNLCHLISEQKVPLYIFVNKVLWEHSHTYTHSSNIVYGVLMLK